MHVVIFGPVAVGKSSVVTTVAACWPKSVVMHEPVEAMVDSGALAAVYANAPHSGYRLQMLVLTERLAAMWRAFNQLTLQRGPNGTCQKLLLLADGHMSLDQHIFLGEHLDAGRMDEADVVQYHTALETMTSIPVCPSLPVTLYVYLRADGATCYERAVARSRAAETTLDQAFFDRNVAACEAAARCIVPEARLVTIDATHSLHAVLGTVNAAITEAYKECR